MIAPEEWKSERHIENLLEWDYYWSRILQQVKTSYIDEKFREEVSNN